MPSTDDNTCLRKARPQRPHLADVGGQYAPAIGDSTKDVTDRQRDAEALADFNAAWEAIRYGTLAGREW